MKVLWAIPYVPYPTTNGGKLRQYGLIRAAAEQGHKITLLCLAKDAPAEADLEHLRQFTEKLIVVHRRDRRHPLTIARALLSPGKPAVASVNGHNQELTRRFAELLEEGPDIVQLEHSWAFQPFDKALGPGRAFVLTEHNDEPSIVSTQISHLPKALRPAGALDRLRWLRWERYVLRRPTAVVAVTDKDAEHFRSLGVKSVHTVVNCIDTDTFAANRPDPQSKSVVFLGNYEYSPNVDAVTWLCDEIMPAVWRQEPEATLRVYGYKMPEAWRQRWPDPRIDFAGFVKDVQTAHGSAAVFVAPIQSGGGSKLKMLEAMASALPIVATREGASGLQVSSGRELRLGGDAQSLADAIVWCLSDRDGARRMGEAARDYVREHHGWRAGGAALEAVWRSVAGRPAATA